ncbi:family 43 glycosylhydrolase [Aestuariibaculum marinum]|uniref:Family 43 glycosylhydrolase n=1 Tax=Aestuariibaculum marinum TaxID=2683592 RepID=A0A8J6Q0I5_9FLAO|nr:family 43 glycosylhydrolase [Aestuariibaculum marinum]MBD0822849.1 family 43 glycosylhydrolase [Aestuariibaculum marinum]
MNLKTLQLRNRSTINAYLTLLAICIATFLQAQNNNIKNDSFWDTKNGEPIYSQGGGIFKFLDHETGEEKYYWYGVHYKQAEMYRADPSVTQARNNFVGVSCYTSTDLVNWKFEDNVLTQEEVFKDSERQWAWLGRMGVAYVKEADKYVLIIQYGARVLFATADSPLGPFKKSYVKSMEDWIGTTNTGDQTVFTDEDTGKSYLVYSYGKGRHKIYISEIGLKNDTITLLNYKQVFKGAGREGNCMFKYKGKYYLAASQLYGWDGSNAYYLVADDIFGPYLPENDMQVFSGAEDDYAHISQTGFFVTVRGSKQETAIFCGDRWADFAGNGLGYNQWCPLSFDGFVPYFNSINSWNLNEKTGEWEVAADNNWIKNPSFEADRKQIPSHKKPVQTRLLGWETTVINGTEISLDSLSPVLNHANTEEERKVVIGERSLNMSDSVNFIRKVHQTITSSPYVTFENDTYNLKAKIKNSDGFKYLKMYAKSGAKHLEVVVTDKNETWTTISIKNIEVTNNEVEVGFLADGKAGAYCLVDDVSLVKSN